MITNLFYLEELSTAQTEAISGGVKYKLDFGTAKYECEESDKNDGDWSVTWVRGSNTGGKGIYSYSCKYRYDS